MTADECTRAFDRFWRATDARTLTRPSWALDDSVWVVADGNSVVRVIREEASGEPARIPVDSAAVTSRFPGVISELQLSRDGTRVAVGLNVRQALTDRIGAPAMLLLGSTLQMAALAFVSGGTANPFVLMLIAPVTLAAATLPLREA